MHLHIRIEKKHLSAEKAEELFKTDEQIKLGEMFAQYAQEHSGPDYLVVPFLLHNLSIEERATSPSVPATICHAGAGAGNRAGQSCKQQGDVGASVSARRGHQHGHGGRSRLGRSGF
jgi:hypothetical protein